MSIYDKSGVGFPDAPSDEVSSLVGGVGGLVAGVGPVAAGLGGVASMFGDGMFGSDDGGMDMSSAAASGTFYSGPFTVGRSSDTLIIVVAVLLGLLIFFKGKSK